MGHVSRKYLREKWKSIKNDMENYLAINDESLPDKIDEKQVAECLPNIETKCRAIIDELHKYTI